MIAVDTNILVYAHRAESPKHGTARARVVSLVESSSRWGLPVFCIGEFLRVLTHPRLFNQPHTAEEACDALGRLLDSPNVVVLRPGLDYPALFAAAVREVGAIGNIVFDAQIVALCRESGVSRLLTEDRDFDRFKGLTVERLEI